MELRVAEAEHATIGCVDPVAAHAAVRLRADRADATRQAAQRGGAVVVAHDLLVGPVAVAVVLPDGVAQRTPLSHPDTVTPPLARDGDGGTVARSHREEVRVEAEVDVELGAGNRDAPAGSAERDGVHAPVGGIVGMARIGGRAAEAGEGADLGPRALNGGVADRRRPLVVGVAGAGHAHRVAVIGHRGERRLLVGTRGVAARRRGVLGGGDRAVGHDHDLARRVVGGGDARRRLVLGAAVGLAGEVAGVGVAPVAAEVGQNVGADRHGLGLELLEAPVHALGACATQAGPARRRLSGHGVRHVLLERHRVDGPRLTERVVERRQRAVHDGAPAGDAQLQEPAADRSRGGRGLIGRHLGPRPPTPGPGVDRPRPARLLEADGGCVDNPRRRHAAQRLHDDVEAVVLGHGDPHAGGVTRQSMGPRGGEERHGRPVGSAEVGRRVGSLDRTGRRAPRTPT